VRANVFDVAQIIQEEAVRPKISISVFRLDGVDWIDSGAKYLAKFERIQVRAT
jgi:hypothetical protein